MNTRSTSGSFKHFPKDLLLASGFPFLFITIFAGSLVTLRGTAWIVAFIASMLVALSGAALIFRAKRPFYRKGIFCTVGISGLPEASHATYWLGVRLSIVGCIVSGLLTALSFLWR